MLATFSQKGDPKIHPDTPRNACGLPLNKFAVFSPPPPRSPNQVIILSNHHVLVMFHVTYDIIVKTLSPFMTSIIRNLQSFPELPAGSTD
jgi:hypothetical protein